MIAIDEIANERPAKELADAYDVASATKLLDFIDGLLLAVALMPDIEVHEAFARAGIHFSHVKTYRDAAKRRGLV